MCRAIAAALGATVVLLSAKAAVSTEAPLPTSSELLKQGFAPVGEGDLLMRTAYTVFRTPVIGEPEEGGIFGERAVHETFVRLRRGEEEFVCILDSDDRCHRVREQAGSGQR